MCGICRLVNETKLSASTFLTPGIWRALKKILFFRQIRTIARSNPSILVSFAVCLLMTCTTLSLSDIKSTLLFLNSLHHVLRPTTIGKKLQKATIIGFPCIGLCTISPVLAKEDAVPARLCSICVKRKLWEVDQTLRKRLSHSKRLRRFPRFLNPF